MPTFQRGRRFDREYRRLTLAQKEAFREARRLFVEGLRRKPPAFANSLRIKAVQGHPGVFELSFAADGRATFQYGSEVRAGEPHIVWRRIGDHSILKNP